MTRELISSDESSTLRSDGDISAPKQVGRGTDPYESEIIGIPMPGESRFCTT
jgi:hypothetical protein